MWREVWRLVILVVRRAGNDFHWFDYNLHYEAIRWSFTLWISLCNEKVQKCAFLWVNKDPAWRAGCMMGELSRGEIKSCHLHFPPCIVKSVNLQPWVQSSLNLSVTALCMRPLILTLKLILLLFLLSFSHPIHSAISYFLCWEPAFALYTLVVSTAQCSALGSLIYKIQ